MLHSINEGKQVSQTIPAYWHQIPLYRRNCFVWSSLSAVLPLCRAKGRYLRQFSSTPETSRKQFTTLSPSKHYTSGGVRNEVPGFLVLPVTFLEVSLNGSCVHLNARCCHSLNVSVLAQHFLNLRCVVRGVWGLLISIRLHVWSNRGWSPICRQ